MLHSDLSQTPCDLSPDIVYHEGTDTRSIESLARGLGILIQPNAPETILVNLPAVESLIHWPRSNTPFGKSWSKEKFCVETLSWIGVTGSRTIEKKPELLRFERYGRPFYYIRIGSSAIPVPGQMGKFFVLIRHRVMHYDRSKAELSVRPICRPPLFVERALSLCSGFPARFDSEKKLLVYSHVPAHIAQLAARLLRQEIL